MKKAKLSPVAEAYARAKPARDWLHANARCMEATEDKAGILWERWILVNKEGNRHASVLLHATPHTWDVFAPVTRSQTTEQTLDALEALRNSLDAPLTDAHLFANLPLPRHMRAREVCAAIDAEIQ